MPTALALPMQFDGKSNMLVHNLPQFNWGFLAEPEPALNGRTITCPRGRTLGGSSSINGGAAFCLLSRSMLPPSSAAAAAERSAVTLVVARAAAHAPPASQPTP